MNVDITQQAERQARLEELRRELDKGIASLDQGKGRIFDDKLVDEICERGMARLAKLRSESQ